MDTTITWEPLATDDPRYQELMYREPLFHRLRAGATRTEIAAMVDDEFFEVGASGRRYDREFVIQTVVKRYAAGEDPDPQQWTITDFQVRAAGSHVYLVTYGLEHRGQRSKRSTLWRRSPARWIALYHQGTRIH